jgi:hypothetical protein
MISVALEQLVAAIESAKRIPLTGQIRVDPEEMNRVLESARVELPQAARQLDRLEDLIAAGMPVPLTPEVRIDRRRALSLLKKVREAS